jgi:hypothetical protein
MKEFINEGIISLFFHTNIWDNIGYCDKIDIETMFKYQEHFNNKSWESIMDHREDELSEEQIAFINEKLNNK